MSKKRISGAVPLALLAAFAAGATVDHWLGTHGPPKPPGADVAFFSAAENRADARATRYRTPAEPAPAAMSGDIRRGRLRMPIDGASVDSLKGGFAETRGGSRAHEAVDILAPRHTPVHAVDSGTIAKLFTSKAGGLTIYQFDPTGQLCYYYAHLQRYADNLKDGLNVSQGDVIGYVGTTGNAPPNTPHLHFAVFELNGDRRWWQGKAIDPYLVFKNKGT